MTNEYICRYHCGHYIVLQKSVSSVYSSFSDLLAPNGSKYELGAHPSLSPWVTSHQPEDVGKIDKFILIQISCGENNYTIQI